MSPAVGIKRSILAIAAMVIMLGLLPRSAHALPVWKLNGNEFAGRGVNIKSVPSTKLALKNSKIEVECNKSNTVPGGIGDEAGGNAFVEVPALNSTPTLILEECEKVTEVGVGEEKCEVEKQGGKHQIVFNQFYGRLRWKNETGGEVYVYFNEVKVGGVRKVGGTLATIKLVSKTGKTCKEAGEHPVEEQLLANLNSPSAEQEVKSFSLTEVGTCGRATSFYSGEEPSRMLENDKEFTISGIAKSEFCGEFEVSLVFCPEGTKFSAQKP